VLWPDHKLRAITATITVMGKCDPNPTIRLVSITSNELDNGLGDGDQPNDIQETFGTDDRTFPLRSERGGLGRGRVCTP
jgi:endo-1,4-beta-xylanase